MKWTPGYSSKNVEDRRNSGGGGIAAAGLLIPLTRRFGLPGLLIGAALLFVVPRFMNDDATDAPKATSDAAEQQLVEFVSFVFDDVQSSWQGVFEREHKRYGTSHIVLFRQRTETSCGLGAAAVGPFYCPRDQNVYIDLGFYRALKQKLGAPGDFAQAYVIAHEVGHHVQNLLGDIKEHGSIATELQADCYAGVWAKSTDQRKLLEAGDIDEAINAAAQIGDDRLQKMETGTVQPEKWTHGSSAQRVAAFKKGFAGGTLAACASQ